MALDSRERVAGDGGESRDLLDSGPTGAEGNRKETSADRRFKSAYPMGPNQIAVLDSNGKTISEYWHSGGLIDMVLADLDGDGREEIVATGIANGHDHQATLVVLDPDRVFGASTDVRPEFQIHGMGAAQVMLR